MRLHSILFLIYGTWKAFALINVYVLLWYILFKLELRYGNALLIIKNVIPDVMFIKNVIL